MPAPPHDVVVVGSGAGGGAAAWALSRHGARVLVLEAGPVFDPFKDYRLSSNAWERLRFPDWAVTGACRPTASAGTSTRPTQFPA